MKESKSLINLVRKYNLDDDWDLLVNRSIQIKEWKERVKSKMSESEEERLNNLFSRSSKCSILKDEEIRTVSTECLKLNNNVDKFMFKVRAGSLPLEVESQRYSSISRKNRECKICDTNKLEDLSHFCLDCSSIDKERKDLFAHIEEKNDIVMKDLSSDMRMKYIVGCEGFYSPKTCEMLYKMWKKRCVLKNRVLNQPGADALSVGQSPDSLSNV